LIGKLVRLFLLLLVLAVGLAGGVAYWGFQKFHEPGPAAADITVVIEHGLGVRAIADKLADTGLITDPLVFAAGVRVYGEERPLQAGEYLFPAGLSMRQIMEQMIAGGTIIHRLTIPEGLTSAEIVALVAAAPDLDGSLPAATPADGSLLPETYFFSRGETRAELLERMRKGMKDALAELWPARDSTVALKSVAEAVILASIVEKETALATERPHVASVFFNRLAQGMPLQSDPTVIYALTGGKGPLGRALLRADLQVVNPYNTYVNPGLPPGPIANPGRASLQAVLHPDSTKDLYFVADGTGGHAFAATLDQHNKNVAAWRQQQKQQTEAQ